MTKPNVHRREKDNIPAAAFLMLAAVGGALAVSSLQGAPVVGNISPAFIEIDTSADLYPSGLAGMVDWVKDSLTNTDTATISNSVATGIIPNVTGAAGGKGHWNGVRIVDGFDGNEKDIFLNGGKENDTTTWNIGPGSVGSSKYDISQAYLANNQSTLFFGMERRGNNGSTAFDFEFNQAAPNQAAPYVPVRTVGDVLFTFEMSGSGSSGSATPHFFVWSGTAYVEQIPAPSSLISSINNSETPAGPWGFVDSKANWALGNIPRFEFAEASVQLSQAFPNFTPCSDSTAFVQVRTRSSATDTSDLKDTTKIFQFRFGGPQAATTITANCNGQMVFNSAGSKDSSGGTNFACSWNFTAPAAVALSGTGITGPDGAGVYHSTLRSGVANIAFPNGATSVAIKASLGVTEGVSCTAYSGDSTNTIPAPLSVAITQKDMSGSTLTVTLTASGPSGSAFQWQRLDGSTNWINLASQTNSTLAYSSFETDVTPSVMNLTIDGEPYQGQVYAVQLRVRGRRTVDGTLCESFSQPLTVKKAVAVDP